MKRYLIEKITIRDGKKRISYHTRKYNGDNFYLAKESAYADYDECLERLYSIDYYDSFRLSKGFEFEYRIIEV